LQALDICDEIERRSVQCWISCRDVAPGENYQEAIVRALRGARTVVLVFSEAANSSDEIKKELSLASRYRVPVMALRIEDVEPSDAFAYELSTRQWVDAFQSWDNAIDALVEQIGEIAPAPVVTVRPTLGPIISGGSSEARLDELLEGDTYEAGRLFDTHSATILQDDLNFPVGVFANRSG